MAKKVSRCFSPEATHDESKPPPPPPRQRTIGHQCLYRLSRISCLHTEQGWFPDRLLLPFVNRSILFHEIAEIQYTSVSPLIGQLSFVFIHMHITRSYRIFTFFPWCDMEMPISIVIIVGFVREIRSNLRIVCAYPNGDYPNWSKLNPDYNKKKEIEKNRKTPRNCAYGSRSERLEWHDTFKNNTGGGRSGGRRRNSRNSRWWSRRRKIIIEFVRSASTRWCVRRETRIPHNADMCTIRGVTRSRREQPRYVSVCLLV